jgi:hypothetical protein
MLNTEGERPDDDDLAAAWLRFCMGTNGAGGRGAGLEENCMKDPKRIKIINAIAVHTTKLEQAGYNIVCGEIVKVK